jgi:septal ring factor EnvC (AmiA/AmiB activator)
MWRFFPPLFVLRDEESGPAALPGRLSMQILLLTRTTLAAGIAILLWQGVPVAAETGDDESARLEDVRTRIRDVQSGILAARSESETLMQELQRTEAAAAEAGRRLDSIERQIRDRTSRIGELHIEQRQRRQELAVERARLAAQIRSAYRTGRNDFVKLLLNQEDPALIGRVVAYHDYANRARVHNIAAVQQMLSRIVELEQEIGDETRELENLRGREQSRVAELQALRESRGLVVARLQEFISTSNDELNVLQQTERELAALLDRLQAQDSVARVLERMPPFASLKGSLEWPVAGVIASHFGAPRRGGRLHSQGVTISAAAGSEVRAVGAGQVVFADWFRNMGLLLILDHGGGYMSLYGQNERLLRKPGDIVRAGEIIAIVGDTGGQQQSGLYFEIRRDGSPLDPGQWCRG